MALKTPLTIITGSLGSGKTTLLKQIFDHFPAKIAILMNEFGEINIDSQIIKGKDIEIMELQGGCVCCSLIGEFEAAVKEIVETIDPEYIVVETTGIAEPDALIFDVEESIPEVRLDGIITIVDADLMIQYPQLGHTTRMQIADADVLLLNKIDLVGPKEIEKVVKVLKEINKTAPVIHTEYCKVDPGLLFGLPRKARLQTIPHKHQIEYTSFNYKTQHLMDRQLLEKLFSDMENVSRAKGFVRFSKGSCLVNYVAGRWDFEPFEHEDTVLVFIGKEMEKKKILQRLKECERK